MDPYEGRNGSTSVQPSLNPHQIQSHLAVLETFQTLIEFIEKRQFTTDDGPTAQSSSVSIEAFLHFSLFRFELWIGRIADVLPLEDHLPANSTSSIHEGHDRRLFNLPPEYLPPLDVLMVWYSYCLRSRAYFEDGLRCYPILNWLEFPTNLIVSNYHHLHQAYLVHHQTCLPFHDTFHGQQDHHWVSLTNTAYDPLRFIRNPCLRTVLCPICDERVETLFFRRDDHGQGQEGISSDDDTGCWSTDDPIRCRLQCNRCAWNGTKRDLSLWKLFRDLRSPLTTTSINEHQEFEDRFLIQLNCLGGSLTTERDLIDRSNAIQFNQLLLNLIIKDPLLESPPDRHRQPSSDDDDDDHHRIFRQLVYLLSKMNRFVQSFEDLDSILPPTQLKVSQPSRDGPEQLKMTIRESWKRICAAYSISEPFSVDLIYAMKVEMDFMKKLSKLGWIGSGTDEKQISDQSSRPAVLSTLGTCIARYQAFQDLIKESDQNVIPIPTLDIDLAWKTDRLRGVGYIEEMFERNPRLIDYPRDLDLTKSQAAKHFESISQLWLKKYQIGYSRYSVPWRSVPNRENWLTDQLERTTSKPAPRNRQDRPSNVSFSVETATTPKHQPHKLSPSTIKSTAVRNIHPDPIKLFPMAIKKKSIILKPDLDSVYETKPLDEQTQTEDTIRESVSNKASTPPREERVTYIPPSFVHNHEKDDDAWSMTSQNTQQELKIPIGRIGFVEESGTIRLM